MRSHAPNADPTGTTRAGAPPPLHELRFGPTHRPAGFTTSDITHFDGSPEPIVRELIQNSLDAVVGSGPAPGAVRFVITTVPISEVPGLNDYRGAFVSARRDRTEVPSHDEKTAIARIDRALALPEVTLLVCADTGHGLTPERLRAVLTPGNTVKAAGGAGSYGLGHFAAFAASDLRYVLYASRYRDEGGACRTIASGHAILATHSDPRRRAAGRRRLLLP